MTASSEYGALRAWTLAVLLTLCYTLSVVDRHVFSFVAVDIQNDLGLGDTEIGLLQGFAFSIFYAVAGIPLGWAVDHCNRKTLIAIAIAIWSIMTILCGAAAGFAGLALARIGVGVGESVLSPAVYSLLPDIFDRRRLPIAMAVYSLGPAWASASAALLSGWILTQAGGSQLQLPLIGAQEGWRVVFFAAGAPGLFLVPLIMLSKEPKRTAAKRTAIGSSPAALAPFLMNNWRTHVFYILAITITTMMSYALIAWAPASLTRSYGWSPAEIGAVLAPLTLAGGVIGCVLGGALTSWVISKGQTERALYIVFAGVALMGVFGVLALFAANGVVFAVGLAAAYVASPLLFMIGPTLLQLITPPQLRGRMSAVFLLANIGIGAGAGPLLVAAYANAAFSADSQLALALGAAVLTLCAAASITLFMLRAPMERYIRLRGAERQ